MNRRILIVDDNHDIHEDFRKILAGGSVEGLEESYASARSAFLGAKAGASASIPIFDLGFTFQGQEGLESLRTAREEGQPYAVAFVDVRMPPGWDGIQTTKRLWEDDPDLQVVICTAYADYSFDEIIEALGASDRLLVLKKPFDPVEVRQLAVALTEKWGLVRRNRERMEELCQAEQEARRTAAALARSNSALEEAMRQATAASKAKSEFLANMSHEIRTPMNGILGYGELICDPSIPLEDRLRYGEIIRQSGDHLLTILNDILDISKIESGRMEVSARAFEPSDLVQDVVEFMRSEAEGRGLALGVEFVNAIPRTIESDPLRVRQVLFNLVGNAVKFTDDGAVQVRVRTERSAEGDGAWLCFDVVDTGCGIEPDQLPALFDAFSQADSSTTRQVGGTGLGLAISKRLAAMLGGEVTVKSAVGKGSTFTLRLDLGSLDDHELVHPVVEAPAARVVDATVDSPLDARVLLVEDGAVNQLLISTVLSKAGAEVAVADDGRAGCRAVRDADAKGKPFDVILMDMQMPVMDGYEAARTLRSEGFGVPIVALTAHAMAGDREKCLEAGCSDYATKPINRLELLTLCHRLVALERAGSALAAPKPRQARQG